MQDLDASDDLARLPAAGLGGSSDALRAVGIAAARNLDLPLVALGVAFALALGGPVFGLLAGAGGWFLQRAVAVVSRRVIERAAAPGSRLGLDFIEAFARIWLLAGVIVLAGAAGHRSDGLAAALVIGISYSIAFAVRIARGRPQGGALR
jgi:hypothetical protein